MNTPFAVHKDVRLNQTENLASTAIFSPEEDTDILAFGGVIYSGGGDFAASISWTDPSDVAQSIALGPQVQMQGRVKGGTSVHVLAISSSEDPFVYQLYSCIIEIGA